MNLELKVLAYGEDSSFRHPQLGLNRCPDSQEEWDKCDWLDDSKSKPTYQQLVDQAYPIEHTKAELLADLRKPFSYQGVLVSTLRKDVAFYETIKRSAERNKLTYPTFILGDDGNLLILNNETELNEFHSAVEVEANNRAQQFKTALGL